MRGNKLIMVGMLIVNTLAARSMAQQDERRPVPKFKNALATARWFSHHDAMHDQMPASRTNMFAKVRKHAELLTTQFDRIEKRHRAAAGKFVDWIEKNYHAGEPLPVIVICTGNSRRSIIGSTMGNIAAAYYGLPDIRFYSGGTAPSAFNRRTIATLTEIGVEIETTGRQAPRGKGGEENPIYKVHWGKGQESLEFSKVYSDAHNPQKGFAALLVCSEADAACPTVSGAGARIAVPYDDPKQYDGTPLEAAKYAERRDDIGRFMLSALMQARRRLDASPRMLHGESPDKQW